MRMLLTFVAIAMITGIEGEASADERSAQSPKAFALQIVVVDVGTILGGALLGSPEIAALGYAIGSPIVHWAHRDVMGGFMSLALHVVAPVVGAFAARAAEGDQEFNPWGVAVGATLATTLDAAVLARPPQRKLTVIAGTF